MLKETFYDCALENGNSALLSAKVVSYTPVFRLVADDGMLLTDGGEYTGTSRIVPSEEADKYYEIVKEDE